MTEPITNAGPPTECVTDDRLAMYLNGMLSANDSEIVDTHARTCASCSDRLERIASTTAAEGESDEGISPNALFLERLKRLNWPSAGPPGRVLGEIASNRPTETRLSPRSRLDRGGIYATIPGFRIVREIGRGGMGVVYEAVELALNRRVALKILASPSAAHRTTAERFRREARAAARLHHTNIVPVFGVGEGSGHLYYAMQMIDGEGLDRVFDRLRRGGVGGGVLTVDARSSDRSSSDAVAETVALTASDSPAPLDLSGSANPSGSAPPRGVLSSTEATGGRHHRGIARIGWQVAEALAYAHKQGLLHRDIKPSNLLIDAEGTAWVTDFGLAKAFDGEEALTRTGDIVGTLRFMAPERFDGRSDVRGDVYAVGVTLYELLTLRPIFSESDRPRLIQKVLGEEPIRPRQVDRHIPRDLETIVLKAIAKEPGARYARAADLAEDLRRFLAGEAILSRRAGATEKLLKWSRRNPAIATLVMALATVLVGGLIATSTLWARAAASAELARDNADKATRLAASEARTRAASVRESARLELDTGTLWARQGRIGRGLLWMDRGRTSAPRGADALKHAAGADMTAWAASAVAPSFLLAHRGRVEAMALGPDGRTLAVGTIGEIVLWDLPTKRKLRTFEMPGSGVDLWFTPDGRGLVTTTEYTGLRLWDVASGAMRQLTPADNFILCGGFTPGGDRLLASNYYSGVAWMVPLAEGLPIGKAMSHGSAARFVLGPDGTRAVSSGDENTIRTWDAETGEAIPTQLGKAPPATAVFTPDGSAIMTLPIEPGPGAVRVYEAASGNLGAEIPTRSAVQGLAFRPDGQSVLICEQGGTASLHDLATGREIGATIGAEIAIGWKWSFLRPPAAFGPDGQTIATAHLDNTVRLWDVVTGRPIGPVLEHGDSVRRLVFLADGRTLLTASRDGLVRAWDLAPAFFGRRLPGPVGVPSSDASHDGSQLVVADLSPEGVLALASEGVVRLLDPGTGLPIAPPLVHDRAIPPSRTLPLLDLPRIRKVLFSPDGRTLATAADDGYVRLWDAATGRASAPPLPHDHWVTSLCFSPDGKTLATGCAVDYARLWDVATGLPRSGRLAYDPNPGSPSIQWLAFGLGGRVFLSQDSHSLLRIWEGNDGKPIPFPDGFQTTAENPVLSPDGTTLLLSSAGVVRSLNLERLTFSETRLGGERGATRLSPDGREVVIVDGTDATIWDVATGRLVGEVMEHPATVTAVAFRPGHGEILTGSRDGRIRRWDAETGRPIGPERDHGQAIDDFFLAPDGRSVLAVGGYATFWPLTQSEEGGTDRLSAIARRLAMRELTPQGSLRRLPPADWDRLADVVLAPGEDGTIALHDEQASRFEADGRITAALWHLDRLVALDPENWAYFARRARVQRAAGNRTEADADLARAESLGRAEKTLGLRAELDLEEARDDVATGRIADAIVPLGRLIAAKPGDEPLLRRRGELLAGLRRWRDAETDLGTVVSHGYLGLDLFYEVALLRLALDDREGYAKLRRRLLKDPEAFESPLSQNMAAWISVLGTAPEEGAETAVALARKAAEFPLSRSASLNTLGAALYRQGHDIEAIKAIEEGIKLRRDDGFPQDWAFLAMAHARLGHVSDAHRFLDLLNTWRPTEDFVETFENLEIFLLRREANASGAGVTELPADVFAH